MATTPKTFAVRFERPATGTHSDAVARDVSLGGMFVVTDDPPDEGTLLVIELDLEGVKVSVDARVLRRESDGMAVALLDLPEDVAATLSAAVTPTSARTILGVGSTNIKATTPGLAVPSSEPRVPIAVPSVNTTTPGIASPVAAPVAAKAAEAEKATKKEEPRDEEPPQRASSVPPSSPPKEGGSGGRWLLVLALAGACAAAYVYREPLRRELDEAIGPATPTAQVAPDGQATTPPIDATLEETRDATTAATSAGDASATDGSASDASARDASARDASASDAGSTKDAGSVRDAGHREAGAHK